MRFVLILAVALLSGCSLMQPKIVKEVEYVKTTVPASLFAVCEVTEPPNAEAYVNLTPSGKEDTLASYITFLHRDIANCNAQLRSIRVFIDNRNLEIDRVNNGKRN